MHTYRCQVYKALGNTTLALLRPSLNVFRTHGGILHPLFIFLQNNSTENIQLKLLFSPHPSRLASDPLPPN